MKSDLLTKVVGVLIDGTIYFKSGALIRLWHAIHERKKISLVYKDEAALMDALDLGINWKNLNSSPTLLYKDDEGKFWLWDNKNDDKTDVIFPIVERK